MAKQTPGSGAGKETQRQASPHRLSGFLSGVRHAGAYWLLWSLTGAEFAAEPLQPPRERDDPLDR
jgi:hypothetical protein